jgi:hypothetical protein
MTRKTGQATVECKIERSPFSDERIYFLTLGDGSEHVGAASYIYFTDRTGQPLREQEPPRGKSIRGTIEAIVIRDEGDRCVVSLPDGSVASVSRSAVKRGKEASPDVPIQP